MAAAIEKPSANRLAAPGSAGSWSKLGAGDAGHHRKLSHRAVDAAIDPVAEIADMRPAFEPPGDVAWGVSMLEMPGVMVRPCPRVKGYVAWSAGTT